ncbi:MAG: DUF1592 domain-containing protein, partial [Verrucomicrobiota bacterium]
GKVKGRVNLLEIASAEQLLKKPKLIEDLIGAIDAYDMPPEDEPELPEDVRLKLLNTLKPMLVEAVSKSEVQRIGMRRLNRLQYNNSLRDLFQLKRDIFGLPEKMMIRHGNYLTASTERMPDRVDVECQSLQNKPGFQEVEALPKDLRASHGFDNQANQLTLSPLLLDAFLKLSLSILNSPDFKPDTVGIWKDYFEAPPEGTELRLDVEKRLKDFLDKAFRMPTDPATLKRYADYTLAKIEAGTPFTESMKKVTSAIFSSPLFLFRFNTTEKQHADFQLASRLSYFLWSSTPDAELLELAARGELTKPDVLTSTIDRMLADPKVERFLDTFPAQWMQLENLLAATPDSRKFRFFNLNQAYPASMQMALEPLLLFDAVFVENRPIVELIAPTTSYRSEFLDRWYFEDLKPPPYDKERVVRENRQRDTQR